MVSGEAKARSLEQRKLIFLALVAAQEIGMTVAQSRKVVAERYGISEQSVRQIEQEGLDNNWPPLR